MRGLRCEGLSVGESGVEDGVGLPGMHLRRRGPGGLFLEHRQKRLRAVGKAVAMQVLKVRGLSGAVQSGWNGPASLRSTASPEGTHVVEAVCRLVLPVEHTWSCSVEVGLKALDGGCPAVFATLAEPRPPPPLVPGVAVATKPPPLASSLTFKTFGSSGPTGSRDGTRSAQPCTPRMRWDVDVGGGGGGVGG